MISKNVLKLLNDQINFEHFSSNIYLQMSANVAALGFSGFASFFKKQAKEELEHMEKMMEYVLETGNKVEVGAIEAPKPDYGTVKSMFTTALEHERIVTSRIHAIADKALTEKDFASFNFIQWFIAEQVEEEANFMGIVDKIENMGEAAKGALYMLDRELGQ